MKKSQQHMFILSALLSVTTLFLSCKKFVDIPPPRNQIVTSSVFTDSANASAAVLGLYVNMLQASSLNIASGGVSVYSSLSADDLATTLTNESREFFLNDVSLTNSQNWASLWVNAYQLIYQANACVEGISASNLSAAVKNRLTGECKFVRAFIYFNLINLYGDVPLILSTSYEENRIKPRNAVSAVYEQILVDLLEAQNLLPVTYITAQRLRPNKHTASALLSKVYLYTKKWTEAETTASQIINSGTYTLLSNLNNVYLAASNEAIWKMRSVFPGVETWEGYYLLPFSATDIPGYILSDTLYNSFEATDARKANWINTNTVGGVPYHYPFKYKLGYDGLTTQLEHYVVFRLAEQYLIRAEARAQQNNLSGAISDLNIIRSRANLPSLPNSLNLIQVMAALEKERRTELFCEWGNRWFDLKRWNKANTVLSALKGSNWQATDSLYPIPQQEIALNPFIIQNSGY